LERKMRFFVFRSGKSHRGSKLASRQPRGVSEGILEGPVPMVIPGLRKNVVGIPEILLSWMKQRSGGTSRERLHQEDRPCLRNLVPELRESGPSTRVFDQPRERENHDSWCGSTRELTKRGPSKSAGGEGVSGSTLTLRRLQVSKSGDDSTSLGAGVPAKQLRPQ
jgi:hypothetical protein